MATENETSNSNILVALQVQLGEIKGILNTIVTEHARRIGDGESNQRQLRFDLEAVKTEAKKDNDALNEKLMQMAIKAGEDGQKHLAQLNESITTNKNNVAELRSDVDELKSHNSATWGKVLGVLGTITAGIALIWQATGK